MMSDNNGQLNEGQGRQEPLSHKPQTNLTQQQSGQYEAAEASFSHAPPDSQVRAQELYNTEYAQHILATYGKKPAGPNRNNQNVDATSPKNDPATQQGQLSSEDDSPNAELSDQDGELSLSDHGETVAPSPPPREYEDLPEDEETRAQWRSNIMNCRDTLYGNKPAEDGLLNHDSGITGSQQRDQDAATPLANTGARESLPVVTISSSDSSPEATPSPKYWHRTPSFHQFGTFALQPLEPGELILDDLACVGINWPENQSPQQLVLVCRDLASQDVGTLAELASLVGFASTSHQGITPQQLRDQLLQANASTQAALARTVEHFAFPHRPQKRRDDKIVLSFPMSKVNHSCKPNAEACISWRTGEVFLLALHDIEVGEEITVTYINPFADRATRHHNLGFQCNCHICRLYGQALSEDEEMRRSMAASLDKIMKCRRSDNVQQSDVYVAKRGLVRATLTRPLDLLRVLVAHHNIEHVTEYNQGMMFLAYDTAAAISSAFLKTCDLEDRYAWRRQAMYRRLCALNVLNTVIAWPSDQIVETVEQIRLLFFHGGDDSDLLEMMKDHCNKWREESYLTAQLLQWLARRSLPEHS